MCLRWRHERALRTVGRSAWRGRRGRRSCCARARRTAWGVLGTSGGNRQRPKLSERVCFGAAVACGRCVRGAPALAAAPRCRGTRHAPHALVVRGAHGVRAAVGGAAGHEAEGGGEGRGARAAARPLCVLLVVVSADALALAAGGQRRRQRGVRRRRGVASATRLRRLRKGRVIVSVRRVGRTRQSCDAAARASRAGRRRAQRASRDTRARSARSARSAAAPQPVPPAGRRRQTQASTHAREPAPCCVAPTRCLTAPTWRSCPAAPPLRRVAWLQFWEL
jgi:hypothetical protein